MKIKRNTQLAALAAASLLAGCDDVVLGNDPMNGCTPITGGGTAHSQSISNGCTNCAVANPERVMDGDAATYAALSIPNKSEGLVTLRVTAQSGVSYPAGSPVGLVVSVPASAGSGAGATVATYQSGVVQEIFNLPASDGVARRRLFTTAQGYNAVEVRITQGTGGAGVGLRAHEFCAD